MKISDIKQQGVTVERVRELFNYDPNTGRLIRKLQTSWRSPAGANAGNLSRHGYQTIRIDGQVYMVHRVIWLHVYGQWPSAFVDHINGNRADNRIGNLRIATHLENACNRKASYRSKTGVSGVYINKRSGKWIAELRRTRIGTFDRLEQAVEARQNWERKHFGAFAPSASRAWPSAPLIKPAAEEVEISE